MELIIGDILLPIFVAILTYIAVNRLGEWQKRRDYSTLGVAVIASLLEEVGNGISMMVSALETTEDQTATAPPPGLLPIRSWSGMSTIPDEVLLRIIKTAENQQFDGFPPRDCRIHCKNYFEHMSQNYGRILRDALAFAEIEDDWRSPLQNLLADNAGHYIQSARNVYQMLEVAKQLLEANSRAIFPK